MSILENKKTLKMLKTPLPVVFLFSLFFGFLLFCPAQIVKADYEQPDSSTARILTDAPASPAWVDYPLGTSLEGGFTDFQIYGKQTIDNNPARKVYGFRIREDNDAIYTTLTYENGSTTEPIYRFYTDAVCTLQLNNPIPYNVKGLITITPSYFKKNNTGLCYPVSDFIFNPSKYYYVYLEHSYASYFSIYGTATATPPLNSKYATTVYTDISNFGQAYFKLIGSVAIPPVHLLEINYPVIGSTITDFQDFYLKYTTEESVAIIDLEYTNGTLTYWQGNWVVFSGTDIDIQIPKSNLLGFGDWILYATMKTQDNEILISTAVDFTISVSGTGGVPGPEPPPVITCGEFDYICQFQQWFSVNLQSVLTWLFVPSSASVNKFQLLFDPIKNKVPIGYLTSLLNGFQSVSSSGTATFSIASMSSLSTLTVPIDMLVAFLFWLLIAFWLLKRIAKMEL